MLPGQTGIKLIRIVKYEKMQQLNNSRQRTCTNCKK